MSNPILKPSIASIIELSFLLVFPFLLLGWIFVPSLVAQDSTKTVVVVYPDSIEDTTDTIVASSASDTLLVRVATASSREVDQDALVFRGSHIIEKGIDVGDVVVFNGDLTVRGRVLHDAIVMNGDIILEEGGVIQGDAVVLVGRIRNNGGMIYGDREEGLVRRAIAPHPQVSYHRDSYSSDSEGFLPTLSLVLLLFLGGFALIFYEVDAIEGTRSLIKASRARAFGVGLAGTFLILPAFVLMLVAFALTLVGLPLLALAVPGYIMALILSFVLGIIAFAYNVGESTASRTQKLSENYRTPTGYLITGLVLIFSPLLIGQILEALGVLGFISGSFQVVGVLFLVFSALTGFGGSIMYVHSRFKGRAARKGAQEPDAISSEN